MCSLTHHMIKKTYVEPRSGRSWRCGRWIDGRSGWWIDGRSGCRDGLYYMYIEDEYNNMSMRQQHTRYVSWNAISNILTISVGKGVAGTGSIVSGTGSIVPGAVPPPPDGGKLPPCSVRVKNTTSSSFITFSTLILLRRPLRVLSSVRCLLPTVSAADETETAMDMMAMVAISLELSMIV